VEQQYGKLRLFRQPKIHYKAVAASRAAL